MKNHINGIEEFWSFAKHLLYNYRGVSRYHFPMYLKEAAYRFNPPEDAATEGRLGLVGAKAIRIGT